MAGSVSSEKCWWRDCCKASLCQSACCSTARALCVWTPLKNWFIYKWFVISLRLPIWNWSRGDAVCSTKSNLSWTCNQQRRRIFYQQREMGAVWSWLTLISLMTGSSFAGLPILQNLGRIWMKSCNAFSDQQDAIWVFFSGLKGSCDCFCLSLQFFPQSFYCWTQTFVLLVWV